VSDPESYVRWLSRYFYVPGYAAEDLQQEARIAMLGSPYPRRAARLRILDLLKMSQRRPQLRALVEVADPTALEDIVDARLRLRQVLDAPLAPREREALGRAVRGEPIPRTDKALQSALVRARRKLRAESS